MGTSSFDLFSFYFYGISFEAPLLDAGFLFRSRLLRALLALSFLIVSFAGTVPYVVPSVIAKTGFSEAFF